MCVAYEIEVKEWEANMIAKGIEHLFIPPKLEEDIKLKDKLYKMFTNGMWLDKQIKKLNAQIEASKISDNQFIEKK